MSLCLSNTNRRTRVSLSVIIVGWESPVLGNIKTLAKNFNFLFYSINIAEQKHARIITLCNGGQFTGD